MFNGSTGVVNLMDVEVIPDWNSLIEMKHEKRVERKIEIASLHIKQKCAVNNEGGGFFLCVVPSQTGGLITCTKIEENMLYSFKGD